MNSADEHAIARLHLDLAHALYCRREELGLGVEELAEAVGLPEERIEMIEQGDTTSLTEVAHLCAILDAELCLTVGYGITLTPLRRPRITWTSSHRPAPAPTEARTGVTIHPSEKLREFFEQPHTSTRRGLVGARR